MARPSFPSGPQYPTFDRFCVLAEDATVVPVVRELVADHLTPVTAFATVGSEPGSYLLESVTGGETWGRYSFVGFEPDLIVRGGGDRFERWKRHHEVEVERGDPWDAFRSEMRSWKPARVEGLPRFAGGAVGYVPYEAVRRFEPTALAGPSGQVELCFALGGTLLVFDAIKKTLRVVVLARIEAGDNRASVYAGALDRIDRTCALLRRPAHLAALEPPTGGADIELPPSSFEREAFMEAVEAAREHIRAGDIFQVVLSQRFRVPLGEVDPLDVYRSMRVVNPSPYMYFLRFPDLTIAGASPETLVRLEDGRAHVRPIAGTRRRGRDPEEDTRIEAELLADPKERAEHVMLVDLGRNDLGRVSRPGSVQLTDRMVVERYSHVMHIVSNVSSELAAGADALDLLRATFPAGTLSGAPKVRAMQIIDDLEPEPRGLYGGAVGYIGFDGNMDLAIAIRTAVVERDELSLQAGAGIVEASDPAAEHEECINKARAGLVALAAARRAER